MLEVVKLEVGDEKSIFELRWCRLEEVLEPSFHLFSMTMTFNNDDFNDDENDDGVLLVQTSKISPRLIAFQFSNYQNIYSLDIHVLVMRIMTTTTTTHLHHHHHKSTSL